MREKPRKILRFPIERARGVKKISAVNPQATVETGVDYSLSERQIIQALERSLGPEKVKTDQEFAEFYAQLKAREKMIQNTDAMIFVTDCLAVLDNATQQELTGKVLDLDQVVGNIEKKYPDDKTRSAVLYAFKSLLHSITFMMTHEQKEDVKELLENISQMDQGTYEVS
ncbi:MAG: hypothetical protein HYV32_03865 [Candidatus Kerfeldbacteria bacterium]|nr:hypothetical protein [Candidatus Kerfeldbacteria bacterium]